MGTQQLLLIVLGVIIVGVAVVVGIGLFGNQTQQANADSVLGDCMRIASGSQTWHGKPKSLGGGGESFIGLTLQKAGWKTSTNMNGSYALSSITTSSVIITGTGNANVTVVVTAYRDSVSSPTITLN